MRISGECGEQTCKPRWKYFHIESTVICVNCMSHQPSKNMPSSSVECVCVCLCHGVYVCVLENVCTLL